MCTTDTAILQLYVVLVRTPPDFITTTTTCMKHSISLLFDTTTTVQLALASTYRIVISFETRS